MHGSRFAPVSKSTGSLINITMFTHLSLCWYNAHPGFSPLSKVTLCFMSSRVGYCAYPSFQEANLAMKVCLIDTVVKILLNESKIFR